MLWIGVCFIVTGSFVLYYLHQNAFGPFHAFFDSDGDRKHQFRDTEYREPGNNQESGKPRSASGIFHVCINVTVSLEPRCESQGGERRGCNWQNWRGSRNRISGCKRPLSIAHNPAPHPTRPPKMYSIWRLGKNGYC